MKLIDKNTKHLVVTPFGIIDFYIPRLDLYVQYDGDFVHGRHYSIKKLQNMKLTRRNRLDGVLKTKIKDKLQNKKIKNLVRIWDTTFMESFKTEKVLNLLKDKGLI